MLIEMTCLYTQEDTGVTILREDKYGHIHTKKIKKQRRERERGETEGVRELRKRER